MNSRTSAQTNTEAILLAGGKGTRLLPYTATFPKPLVPLGDTPIIEVVVKQLAYHGVRNMTVVTGHLAELIEAFLGDGSRYDVGINYLKEELPLDTAGSLGMIDRPNSPFFVMNGDILSTIDFSKMLRFHLDHDPIATIATYQREVKIDLGVLKVGANNELNDYIEKPTYEFAVSMGVYCFSPRVCDYVNPGERLGMPDLILRMRDADEKIRCFRDPCYWLDIGRPDDYAKAVDEFCADPSKFLPSTRVPRLEA